MISRIAIWWVEFQEFNFMVEYTLCKRMKHIDVLSRNPCDSHTCEKVMRIEQADWVLSGHLTNTKISAIKNILL